MNGWCHIVVAVNSPCESMHGNARTFSEQVMASIINGSRCGRSDVAFRIAPPNGGPSCYKNTKMPNITNPIEPEVNIISMAEPGISRSCGESGCDDRLVVEEMMPLGGGVAGGGFPSAPHSEVRFPDAENNSRQHEVRYTETEL